MRRRGKRGLKLKQDRGNQNQLESTTQNPQKFIEAVKAAIDGLPLSPDAG